MSSLTPLEEQVMKMLLDGDDSTLGILRRQFKQVEVSSRKMTGVGFYTEVSVPLDAPRLDGRPSFKLGDVNGTALEVQHGLGFLLYITDGALSMLEGYTYDEPWPDKIRGLALTYAGGKPRDLDDLRQRFGRLPNP